VLLVALAKHAVHGPAAAVVVSPVADPADERAEIGMAVATD
jgi:hypothetical protein